jgi:hypothetical protein
VGVGGNSPCSWNAACSSKWLVAQRLFACTLQFVKAYISIYSDPQGRERAMENLKRLEP